LRISVVTISLNQARFLRECLDSVLGQNHADVECIVVDPGSTDGSREILEAYRDRVIRVFEPDLGPADGLNKGFALATGEVFGFVNADDALLPGALTRVSRAFASRPDADVITGCGYFIDAEGRTSFENVNGFNSANRIAWDGELFLDMCLNGARFARINDDLALFRLHGASITGSGGQSSSDETFRAYRERVFLKATGRNRGELDWLLDRIARIVKYTSDPAYLVARINAGLDLRRRRKTQGTSMRDAQ
jgi:glycosyltransferase involved in cell wall biosynthesis